MHLSPSVSYSAYCYVLHRMNAQNETKRKTSTDLETDMELHRADSEVNDVVDGKYDWRIEKLDNHNGLTR